MASSLEGCLLQPRGSNFKRRPKKWRHRSIQWPWITHRPLQGFHSRPKEREMWSGSKRKGIFSSQRSQNESRVWRVQVSISLTFYEHIFCSKVFFEAFLCLQFGFVIFCRKNIGLKKAACKMIVKSTPALPPEIPDFNISSSLSFPVWYISCYYDNDNNDLQVLSNYQNHQDVLLLRKLVYRTELILNGYKNEERKMWN